MMPESPLGEKVEQERRLEKEKIIAFNGGMAYGRFLNNISDETSILRDYQNTCRIGIKDGLERTIEKSLDSAKRSYIQALEIEKDYPHISPCSTEYFNEFTIEHSRLCDRYIEKIGL